MIPLGGLLLSWSGVLTLLLAMSSNDKKEDANSIKVVGLYRYAIKGLGGDALTSVSLEHIGDTFPDDRRFALCKYPEKFDPANPQWLHKENFLCAFTNPQLMAQYKSHYEINHSSHPMERTLTLWKRGLPEEEEEVLKVNLETRQGRDELATYFSKVSQEKELTCVCSADSKHSHQFGNTSSGVKARGDTRTIHIVNAATVRQVSKVIGVPSLRPERFRPNIIIDGCPPWEEFKWVDSTIDIICSNNNVVQLDVIRTTVRCDGVSIDPDTPDEPPLDIPALLQKHFPQYGPYLGVYAVLRTPGTISIHDVLTPPPPS